ncbi:MAG: hypothetical protein AAGA53_05340 [Pseudomonadota bacterium]
MPTVITRLYKDKATAQEALDMLHEADHHAFDAEIVSAKDKGTVTKKLRAHGLGSIASKGYAKHTKEKRALLIIDADFSPDGGTRRIIEILDSFPTIDVGSLNQERFVDDEKRSTKGKILSNTHFMINHRRRLPMGHVFKGGLLYDRKPRVSLMKGKAHASAKIMPMPLVSSRSERDSTIKGGMLFFSKLGIPSIIRGRSR